MRVKEQGHCMGRFRERLRIGLVQAHRAAEQGRHAGSTGGGELKLQEQGHRARHSREHLRIGMLLKDLLRQVPVSVC